MMIPHGQSQILSRLSQPDAVEYIQNQIASGQARHRTELAEHLCDRFGFLDHRGQRQRSGCVRALRRLEVKGKCRLPAPQRKTGPNKPQRPPKPLPQVQALAARVDALEDLEIQRVEDSEQMQIWNEMMVQDHPDGHGPLVGRQLRYLVRCRQGWLGGVGFAACALRVKDRDAWIGWDAQTRRTHQDRVISMARFLIRNHVHCQNLASWVLGQCLGRVQQDFQEQYGYEPWLVETFVDTAHFDGTCYRASNWHDVGQTQGRGRQDRQRRAAKSKKAIYMYALEADFRQRMGLPPDAGHSPLKAHDGLDGAQWAQKEFGQAPVGDARLSQRLVNLAAAKAQHPEQPLIQALKADTAAVTGYYRFVDHPNHESLCLDTILQPHVQRTLRRMAPLPRVLVVHDETDLNFSGLAECEGLGVVGKNQTQTQTQGLRLHSCFVVSEATGLPLGVLGASCFAPELKPERKGKDSRNFPIEEKETFRWIESLRQTMELSKRLPQTRLINVMDREADFFELFHEWRENPCVDLLVRAQHDRRTGGALSLFSQVRRSALRGHVQIDICRRSARARKGKRAALPARTARTAKAELRYCPVQILPPAWGPSSKHAPVPVWMIHVREKKPPKGQEPVEWYLLTTVKIESKQAGIQCLRWYRFRWRIEDWHRVLKTGCEIEGLAHQTAGRIQRVIGIHLVVAWRIMLMTLLGRESPELASNTLFTDLEIQVLRAHAAKQKKKLNPQMLGDAVELVATLGGYLGRKNDPPPGHEVMCRGYSAFQHVCYGYSLRE